MINILESITHQLTSAWNSVYDFYKDIKQSNPISHHGIFASSLRPPIVASELDRPAASWRFTLTLNIFTSFFTLVKDDKDRRLSSSLGDYNPTIFKQNWHGTLISPQTWVFSPPTPWGSEAVQQKPPPSRSPLRKPYQPGLDKYTCDNQYVSIIL